MQEDVEARHPNISRAKANTGTKQTIPFHLIGPTVLSKNCTTAGRAASQDKGNIYCRLQKRWGIFFPAIPQLCPDVVTNNNFACHATRGTDVFAVSVVCSEHKSLQRNCSLQNVIQPVQMSTDLFSGTAACKMSPGQPAIYKKRLHEKSKSAVST